MDTNTIVSIVAGIIISIASSIGGMWMITDKTVAVLVDQVDKLEVSVDEVAPLIRDVSVIETRLTTTEAAVERARDGVQSNSRQIGQLEVAGVKTAEALNSVAKAIEGLSVTTTELMRTNSELAIVVGKLEERTR